MIVWSDMKDMGSEYPNKQTCYGVDDDILRTIKPDTRHDGLLGHYEIIFKDEFKDHDISDIVLKPQKIADIYFDEKTNNYSAFLHCMRYDDQLIFTHSLFHKGDPSARLTFNDLDSAKRWIEDKYQDEDYCEKFLCNHFLENDDSFHVRRKKR